MLRYGLVIILLWVGALKFTAYEAEGIQGLVANSPLLSWAYSIFSVRTFAMLLGVGEIAIALMIAMRPIAPFARDLQWLPFRILQSLHPGSGKNSPRSQRMISSGSLRMLVPVLQPA